VSDLEARFDGLYRAHFRAVLAYVARRERSSADAADLTAEVFAVAWRRIEAVPEPPDDILWLYGTARRVVSDHARRPDGATLCRWG
jgi:RNA polymerase sigma-70 factor (ECF subfamily)